MSFGWHLLPAIVCFGYFLGGLPVFALRVRKRGLPTDDRVETRSSKLPKWLVYYLLWAIAPLERSLVRWRVNPNALTFVGFLLSLGAAAAVSHGFFSIGGWLYLFVGIVDIFDGRVARATGRVSKSGALYDSVVDCYSECAIFVGLIIYYHQSWVMYVILGALVGSLMVSYIRARAEGLGATASDAKSGAMQRPERVLLLGVAMGASPFIAAAWERPVHPDYVVTVGAVLLLALTSNVTAFRRFWTVFAHLKRGEPETQPAPQPDPNARVKTA